LISYIKCKRVDYTKIRRWCQCTILHLAANALEPTWLIEVW